MFSKLQFISQGDTAKEQIDSIQKALNAGCDWIQLRFKNQSEEAVLNLAKEVKELCTAHSATFILNDFIQVAKTVDADGVHVGLNDQSPILACTILGDKKIIGGTANTLEDVLLRINEKCDYVGLGPFRYTTTKATLSPILGLDGYANIVSELEKLQKSIPIYAIGGIEIKDVEAILNTGIYGVAVSGLIANSEDQAQTVEQLKNLLYVVS